MTERGGGQGAGRTGPLGEGPGCLPDLRPSGFSRQLLAAHARSAPMPHGIYEEVTAGAEDTHSPNAFNTRAHAQAHTRTNTLQGNKEKKHENTLSGGAPNSTRQRKGGWRDGVPSRCCHGNDSG